MMQPIHVRNPRTGEFDYAFTPPTMAELKACANRLRDGNQQWNKDGLPARIAAMQQWKEALLAQRAAVIAALTTDTGRHLLSVIEFDSLAPTIDRWCKLAPALLQEQEGEATYLPSIHFCSQLVPYALVGVISPWNFPLTLSLIDAIPALLAGCSVISKPSEITPRFVAPLQQSLAAVPALQNVLAFVLGAGATGAALINEVDAVCFTGSVKTGRLVAESAARNFIPAFLELGGKDPALVTASANVEQAATTVLRASIVNTGQACQSLERVYVQDRIYEAFVEQLVALAEQVTLNYPDLQHGQLGPLIFARQAEIIREQLADAVSKGAKILCGGAIEQHGGGWWIRPTVIVNVNHTMQVMTEETFGPIIPVMPFATIDEAVALANDSEYGLSASVFAGSEEEALTIARRINAGAISINDGSLTSVMHEAEKHSFKLSGLGGSRMGAAGLLRFLRKKALLVQTGQAAAIDRFDEALLNAAP
jgi:aldehyde dehydrogenase (NAD+)